MNSITQSPSVALDLARAVHADRTGPHLHAPRSRTGPRPPRRRLRLPRPLSWRGRVLPA